MRAEVTIINNLLRDKTINKFFGGRIYQAFAPAGTVSSASAFAIVERTEDTALDRTMDGTSPPSIFLVTITITVYGKTYEASSDGMRLIRKSMGAFNPSSIESGELQGINQVGDSLWSSLQTQFSIIENLGD